MKKNTKVNTLKQFILTIITIILVLTGYITLENKSELSENILNQTTRNKYNK